MPTAHAPTNAKPLWSRRVVEWAVLIFVLLTLVLVFGRQVQVVQGQAELASVKFTLGALRTALVVQHLKGAVQSPATQMSPVQQNPFELLERLPTNFVGNLALADAPKVPAGSWFFDPNCACAGYRLLYPKWLSEPENTEVLRFHVGKNIGPRMVTAMERYVWHGEELL